MDRSRFVRFWKRTHSLTQPSWSLKFPDQAWPIKLYSLHHLFPTESAHVWLSNDWVLDCWSNWSGTDWQKTFILTTLDPYTIISRSNRFLLGQYPITSRSLLERMATRMLLNFFWQSKIIVYIIYQVLAPGLIGNLIDADHLPDRFLVAWSGLIELIWSTVETHLYRGLAVSLLYCRRSVILLLSIGCFMHSNKQIDMMHSWRIAKLPSRWFKVRWVVCSVALCTSGIIELK